MFPTIPKRLADRPVHLVCGGKMLLCTAEETEAGPRRPACPFKESGLSLSGGASRAPWKTEAAGGRRFGGFMEKFGNAVLPLGSTISSLGSCPLFTMV